MGDILYVRARTDAVPDDWATTSEHELEVSLARPLDVLIIGPDTVHPVAVAQQAHRAHPGATILVVVDAASEEQVRRSLRYSPDVPADITLLSAPVPDLARHVAEALEQTLRRRRQATLTQVLTQQMTVTRAHRFETSVAGMAPLGTLLAQVPLGVLVTDPAGALLSWNERAAALLEIDLTAAGAPLVELFTEPTVVEAALTRTDASADAPAAFAVSVLGRTEVALELSAAATQLEDGTPAVLVLLLDVSARRAAEQARDELTGQLAETRRGEAFLLQASDVLAQAAGYNETLQQLAAVAVPALADLCLIDVLDDHGHLQRVAARHADPQRQPLADELRNYPPDPAGQHPSAHVLRTRASSWSPRMSEEFIAATTLNARHAQLLHLLEFAGYIAVPLTVEGRVLGNVTLVATGNSRQFDAADVALAEALAGRVAVVVHKARRYDQEHRLAEALQRNMLTDLPDPAPVKIAARYVPAREDTQVGGDWYDAFLLPNGHLVLVIGDVVGHDLEAATAMGELRNLLRALAFDRQDPAAEVLARLDQLNEHLSVTDFATVIYAILETPDLDGAYRLRWANAGHPPPVLVHADGLARFLDANLDVPLGTPHQGPRQEAVADLPAGSTLLLYTDGLVETRADQLDAGLPALLTNAARHTAEPLEDLCDHVLAAMPDRADDDIAMLAIRLPERW